MSHVSVPSHHLAGNALTLSITHQASLVALEETIRAVDTASLQSVE